MIDSIVLNDTITRYKNQCDTRNKSPSFSGLASLLDVSEKTVSRVVKGFYHDGRAYSLTPHPTRRVANGDFEAVREVFAGDGLTPAR